MELDPKMDSYCMECARGIPRGFFCNKCDGRIPRVNRGMVSCRPHLTDGLQLHYPARGRLRRI